MLIKASIIYQSLPTVRHDVYMMEDSFSLRRKTILKVFYTSKNHFKYQYRLLTNISGIDYPEKKYRFCIAYDFLSLIYNSRVRFKGIAAEIKPIKSIKKVFSSCLWWESEAWDMLGIYFSNHNFLGRLLSDYGFQGHPLRKDFPLSGFKECRYNQVQDQVLYEKLGLAQEYRVFEYTSPWENFKT